MSKCPRYQDTTSCTEGSAGNKICMHCDHNSAGFTPAPVVTDKQDKIKVAMNQILKIFEGDNLEIVTRAVFTAPAGFERPCDKWSFMNRIFMMCAETDDARGYKQWQQVGRQVKKDTHAFSIFGPLIKNIEDKRPVRIKYYSMDLNQSLSLDMKILKAPISHRRRKLKYKYHITSIA